MKRRNFFKKLGCLIAGFAVAPVIAKETKALTVSEVISDYEKALREETDRQAKYSNEMFITNPNFTDWGHATPDEWEYVPMYAEDLPGIVNGQAESKEMFELRKAIYRPITDKLVKKIINGP